MVGRSFDRIDGELTYLVTIAPLYESGYDRADYFVAVKDYALLQVRYYRRGALEPYKFLHARREWMEEYDGHVLPRRIDIVDRSTDTETVIHFKERRINQHLSPAHFSTLSLQKRLRLARYRDRPAPEEDTP